MLQCGLLGEKLKHSYSPMIHAQLADYAYRLYERAPEELDLFLRSAEWDGLNVTIPYKKTVVPYCDVLSPQARQLGSVNTLVHLPDGRLYGDNTDYFGFSCLVDSSGIRVAGRRAVVLGSGGASVTVCAVLHAMGAQSVAVISRRGEDNYQNLDRHADAQIIVNTTPLGNYDIRLALHIIAVWVAEINIFNVQNLTGNIAFYGFCAPLVGIKPRFNVAVPICKKNTGTRNIGVAEYLLFLTV